MCQKWEDRPEGGGEKRMKEGVKGKGGGRGEEGEKRTKKGVKGGGGGQRREKVAHHI